MILFQLKMCFTEICKKFCTVLKIKSQKKNSSTIQKGLFRLHFYGLISLNEALIK